MKPPPFPSSPHQRNSAGFIQPGFLLLLLFLPAAVLFFFSAERRRLHDARKLAGPRGTSPTHEATRRQWCFRLVAAAGFIILALARPAWKEVPQASWREGRDIVFLLDISRSMLAQDLSPNRLTAAKIAIRDCVESLEGDRVALVVFAGSNSILCPLTNDYAFFYDKLDEAHPDFVAPGDVRIGGTRIGDAIHKICDKLLSAERRGFQDLILLSDGGDQDSYPLRAAKRLEELGVHFLVAGLGDAVNGSRIPAPSEAAINGSEFVTFEGREVWSRLEATGLNALAKSCRYGVFLNAGTRALPLGTIYQRLATHFQRHHSGNRDDVMHKQETFPIFLALALLCLCAPLPSVRRRPAQVATLLLAGAFVFLPARGLASPGPALFRTGVKQLAARNFTGSLEAFRAAAETFPDSERRALAWYNAGLACFGQALSDEPLDPLSSQTYYRQSCACFRAAVEMRPSWPDARWNLELALHRLARISRRANGPPSKEKDASERPEQARPQPDSPATEKEEEGARKTDQDRPSEPSSQLDGQRVMDLNAQDIPPPVVEPEDLFQQERESDEARQKNSAANFRPVERDW